MEGKGLIEVRQELEFQVAFSSGEFTVIYKYLTILLLRSEKSGEKTIMNIK